MNNSVTRVILGSLLPSFYFGLIIIVISSYNEGLIRCIISIFIHIKDCLYIALVGFLIPSTILSILVEIANRKRYKYIYYYGAAAGGLIAVIYLSPMFLIEILDEDIGWYFIAKICGTGVYGLILGLLTTIPLRYLYKRQLKKKAKLEASQSITE